MLRAMVGTARGDDADDDDDSGEDVLLRASRGDRVRCLCGRSDAAAAAVAVAAAAGLWEVGKRVAPAFEGTTAAAADDAAMDTVNGLPVTTAPAAAAGCEADARRCAAEEMV